MEKIKAHIIQFKNLYLMIAGILMMLAFFDSLGLFAARRQYRANIENQIMIAQAETRQKIAIIRAETEAALLRIKAEGTRHADAR